MAITLPQPFFRYLFLGFLFIFLSCSKDDENSEQSTNIFYKNKLEAANPEKLYKIWSIFEGSLDGKTVSIPENNPECGRDFFIYDKNGTYTDFLIVDNFQCNPEIYTLNWTLEKGIITLKNVLGESEEFVILELTDQKFIFKANIDYDGDGTKEIFTFFARPYQPPSDKDIYSETFNRDYVDPQYDKIRLRWRPYLGLHNFDRYEIYRSDDNCSKTNAKLIATIKDGSIDTFVDESPVANPELCYFFRLYTDKGLLSESNIITIDPKGLNVALVQMNEPQVNNNTIDLTWSKYTGLYFSYYEISVQNFDDTVGNGDQSELITQIAEINTLSYEDINPPYLLNPVYVIKVVDIFGNKTISTVPKKNSWQINYKRPEVIDMPFIRTVAIDPDETAVYLFGRTGSSYNDNIQKYNYTTKEIVAILNQPITTSSEGNLKVIKSNLGKEVILPIGNELQIYNSSNLNFKYTIDLENILFISDFEYLGNNIWVITDGDHVVTFSRNNDKMTEVSRQVHFPEHQPYATYHILPIANNEIIVGHYNESSSIKFSVSSDGQLSNKTIINSVIRSENEKETIFNASQNKIVGLNEHNIYDTNNFTREQSFIEPFVASGLSLNGREIFGTNNHISWQIEDFSSHEKKAQVYNISNQSISTYSTKGYPHLIFENYLGELISISTGFKRKNLKDTSRLPDFFVEKIIR